MLEAIVRAREVRVRLAQIEALRLRHALLRAEIALADARGIKAGHEARIDEAGAPAAEHGFTVAEAQGRLAFAAGMRIQIREAEVHMRRANLARERVQDECDEASRHYRELLVRRETLISELARQRRKVRLRRLEREDEAMTEDRAMHRRETFERGASAWQGVSHE